jgi:formate dehydrogenase subunit gamma
MWTAVRESGNQPGFTSLPGAEKGVLIQSFVQYPGSRYTTAGEAWRQVRNNWIIPYGGALILVALLAMAIVYWRKGEHGHASNDGQPVIERFTPFERSVHLLNAAAFVALAISGLVMSFGKYVLLPILGSTLFGWLTYALKTLHNFVGPLFVVTLLIFIVTYIKDNLPRAADIAWLKAAGGLFSGQEVPSHRFNAGEKTMFWVGALLLGLTVAASGLVLDKLVPGLGETRGQMQVAQMVHGIAAMIMMAMLLGHIYMALTTRGAIKGMQTGWVDEAWAREHHELWFDDIKAGKLPARRSAEAEPPLGSAASSGA